MLIPHPCRTPGAAERSEEIDVACKAWPAKGSSASPLEEGALRQSRLSGCSHQDQPRLAPAMQGVCDPRCWFLPPPRASSASLCIRSIWAESPRMGKTHPQVLVCAVCTLSSPSGNHSFDSLKNLVTPRDSLSLSLLELCAQF